MRAEAPRSSFHHRFFVSDDDLLQLSEQGGRTGAAGSEQAVVLGAGLIGSGEEGEPPVETLADTHDRVEAVAGRLSRKGRVE